MSIRGILASSTNLAKVAMTTTSVFSWNSFWHLHNVVQLLQVNKWPPLVWIEGRFFQADTKQQWLRRLDCRCKCEAVSSSGKCLVMFMQLRVWTIVWVKYFLRNMLLSVFLLHTQFHPLYCMATLSVIVEHYSHHCPTLWPPRAGPRYSRHCKHITPGLKVPWHSQKSGKQTNL